ncbi:hypothetical protein KY348_00970 [Candidatus Woesearchaeota archaeon]|nr:hypothetical protein [Candidatus Woesearchaeota archaeon]
MDEHEIKELWNIRNFFERKYSNLSDCSNHPYRSLHHCKETSDLIKRVLGYSIRSGSFNVHQTRTPSYLATDIIECFFPHAWNYNPSEKSIVEICGNQFPQIEDKVLIIHINSKLAQRYVFEWNTYLGFAMERRKKPIYINNYNKYQTFPKLKQAKEAKIFV